MTGERAKKLKQDFQDFYSNLFMLNEEEKMTSSRYVEILASSYDLDKGAFYDRMIIVNGAGLKVLDADNDGSISEEEFVIAMKCWGIEKLERKFIQSYPQFKPGFIRNEDFRDSWVAFFTNDDRNDNSIEKPVITGLGIID